MNRKKQVKEMFNVCMLLWQADSTTKNIREWLYTMQNFPDDNDRYRDATPRYMISIGKGEYVISMLIALAQGKIMSAPKSSC